MNQVINPGVMAVEQSEDGIAGALVFWSLSGLVDNRDLVEMAEAEGFDEKYLPAEATRELVAQRAAAASMDGKRQMLRPLSTRGAWDLVEERVTQEDGGKERLVYTELVRIKVEEVAPGLKGIMLAPFGEENAWRVDEINENIEKYTGLHTAMDISSWLLWMLRDLVEAVSLRSRGGFYFVPADRLESWRMVSRIIRGCSNHEMFEIPAVKSDEAVNAIITAVRKEAEEAMAEMEAYLAGDTISTRGLNAQERKIERTQAKVAHYAELLGVSLGDLQEKSVVLLGALNAARLSKASEGNS